MAQVWTKLFGLQIGGPKRKVKEMNKVLSDKWDIAIEGWEEHRAMVDENDIISQAVYDGNAQWWYCYDGPQIQWMVMIDGMKPKETTFWKDWKLAGSTYALKRSDKNERN